MGLPEFCCFNYCISLNSIVNFNKVLLIENKYIHTKTYKWNQNQLFIEAEIIKQHQHLGGINMDNHHEKSDLPAHMVLEANDNGWIKVS